MAVVLGASVLLLTLLCIAVVPSHGALQVGFYRGKCNGTDVEAAIRSVVAARFGRDRSIVPALLRLHFHDCFVRGCDASILLDGSGTEKTAPPNLSVRGYDLIDQAKTELESRCPGVVSCADIIAVATRDAVVLGGGSQYTYAVQTGRRDGVVSLASEAIRNLPGDSFSASQAIAAFEAKGLNASYMVWLLGGHTVGVTHCSFIRNRLYSYNGSGKPDPTMDPALVNLLRSRCPQSSTVDNTVFLDHSTPSTRGVLKVDQNIAMDGATNATVRSLANGGSSFPSLFGRAMVKMGAIQVLTGTQGQIRKSCRVVKK
ncbi:peroxidase [Musa troglodytarum]|uniref:Peroxidase n=1 Tax=Musa troglodytarum TaxID=320322 RepID=A0A9E7JSE8_9LILI|nr:peroxidase [Musa troglodytarum]